MLSSLSFYAGQVSPASAFYDGLYIPGANAEQHPDTGIRKPFFSERKNLKNLLFGKLGVRDLFPSTDKRGAWDEPASPWAESANQLIYIICANAKHAGDFLRRFPGRMQIQNLLNVGVRQFTLWAVRPHRASSLIDHVADIFQLCPFEEMFFSATRAYVTVVTNQQRERVFSVPEEVGYAMSFESKLPTATNIGSHYKRSVPKARSAGPQPAISIRTQARSFVNVAPKLGNIIGGERWQWFTLSLGHLISFTDRVLAALRGDNHAGPFPIVWQVRG